MNRNIDRTKQKFDIDSEVSDEEELEQQQNQGSSKGARN